MGTGRVRSLCLCLRNELRALGGDSNTVLPLVRVRLARFMRVFCCFYRPHTCMMRQTDERRPQLCSAFEYPHVRMHTRRVSPPLSFSERGGDRGTRYGDCTHHMILTRSQWEGGRKGWRQPYVEHLRVVVWSTGRCVIPTSTKKESTENVEVDVCATAQEGGR